MSYLAGIVGDYGPDTLRNAVERMAESLRFRGAVPDTQRLSTGSANVCNVAVLASVRVDDAPGGVLAALDGEIYGVGGSPSERLASAVGRYHAEGPDFLRAVNGAWGIALWSTSDKTLYLGRDHAGCRSLYYAPLRHGIVFASTAAALLASGLVDLEIDPESVDSYFGVKALSPPRTMFRNVFSTRPGHVVVWKDGAIREHDYWRLHDIDTDEHTSPEDFCGRLRDTIEDAVRVRQQAGGTFCALVSGGVDTSAVAALLARQPETPKPLHGLSIAFDEIAYSDVGLQDCIVKTLGVDQHERVLKPEEFASVLKTAVGFLDSPVNDAALVGMYTAFGMARAEGYDVVFEGEGPDELFPAGNTQGELGIAPLLKIPHALRRSLFGLIAKSIPLGDSKVDKIRRICARLSLPDDERRMTWRPILHTDTRRQLLVPAFRSGIDPYKEGKAYLEKSALDDPLNLYQYGLIKTFLPDDLLYKNERMASAHNVMNRTPLVDHRLIELALRIPSRYQIEKPTPATDGIKLLYKAALRGIVPDEILDRKKERGFSQPTRLWFSGALKEFLHETILGNRAIARDVFDTRFLQRIFDEHISGKANHDSLLTSVLIFDLWIEHMTDVSSDLP